jgi:hypothetical protein
MCEITFVSSFEIVIQSCRKLLHQIMLNNEVQPLAIVGCMIAGFLGPVEIFETHAEGRIPLVSKIGLTSRGTWRCRWPELCPRVRGP